MADTSISSGYQALARIAGGLAGGVIGAYIGRNTPPSMSVPSSTMTTVDSVNPLTNQWDSAIHHNRHDQAYARAARDTDKLVNTSFGGAVGTGAGMLLGHILATKHMRDNRHTPSKNSSLLVKYPKATSLLAALVGGGIGAVAGDRFVPQTPVPTSSVTQTYSVYPSSSNTQTDNASYVESLMEDNAGMRNVGRASGAVTGALLANQIVGFIRNKQRNAQ